MDGRTDGRIDGQTDRRTKPLIELLFATKNNLTSEKEFSNGLEQPKLPSSIRLEVMDRKTQCYDEDDARQTNQPTLLLKCSFIVKILIFSFEIVKSMP